MSTREPYWFNAFYDRDYGEDQTQRHKALDDVIVFLKSIGCQLRYTEGYDGSDIDLKYGAYLSEVTYDGRAYEHNACYNVRYELPPEIIERLDARFP